MQPEFPIVKCLFYNYMREQVGLSPEFAYRPL